MGEKGIQVITGADIVSVAAGELNDGLQLHSSTGEIYACDEAVWCTQASAQSWLRESGLEVTQEGFICVQVLH